MSTFRRRRLRSTKSLPSNVTPLRQGDWNPNAGRGDRPRNRGIYLLPNAFTTAALFCGSRVADNTCDTTAVWPLGKTLMVWPGSMVPVATRPQNRGGSPGACGPHPGCG